LFENLIFQKLKYLSNKLGIVPFGPRKVAFDA